jgi:hypothetical protein
LKFTRWFCCSSILILALSLIITLGLAPSAHAQLTTGDIAGTVTDQSGAVIANATIKATNDATGVTVSVKSTSSGDFHITSLPSGIYTLVASAPGFSSFTLRGFQVQLNNTATAKLVLPVGQASTSVQVSADAAAVIDTTTVQLQSTFTEKELQDLPITTVGNGVLNLTLLTPGVSSSGAVGAGTGPSVGGQRPRADNYTIEGIDNNDKSTTGPLLYVPNDAVGEFTAITNQFSPEFGHSAGGQFNTVVRSGTNTLHGTVYEYFDNRNLNAENAVQGGKIPNPRYDFNRYGGELGGPIKKDKIFYFANFERQTTGQSAQEYLCTPTAGGMTTLGSIPNLSATNLGIFTKYTPVAPTQVTDATDNACFEGNAGPQSTTVYDGTDYNSSTGEFASGTAYDIPLGNVLITPPSYSNFYALTTSGDWTISPEDTFRLRYLYNRSTSIDTAANLPAFYEPLPNRFHLIAASEYHNFTPNLVNEARLGYNRWANITTAGNFSFPGLDTFPNLNPGYYDLDAYQIGPDGNAPQSTLQNLYQLTDNLSWTKGKHTFKFGFDGRKFISPQSFTQRARGDYEYDFLTEYLHDLAPTAFGQRSTGNFFYYGDQTAFYGYANDIYRVTQKLSLNYGLRYEFTSVPQGEKVQQLNQAASVPGLVSFSKPQPQMTNFLPRIGIDYAPTPNTAIRAGFGMAVDVLYDNLGILSFPPQYSSTLNVDTSNPYPGSGPLINPANNEWYEGGPNFLANGGMPPGNGSLQTFATVQDQRAATSAYVPNQKLPYAETWSLGVQQVFAKDYTAEVRYLGTRGIHLPTQTWLDIQDKVDATHFLPTYINSTPSPNDLAALPNTLATISARPNLIPAYAQAGFAGPITTFQPFSQSNYNGLAVSLDRRFKNGLLLNGAWTYSKTMDDATADVYSTVLSPRRPQNKQNIAADYGRSALDHTHRITMYAVYDLPFFHGSNWLMKNVVGNWEVAPIYIYESPEYATALSGVDSVLDGDGSVIDRPIFNPSGNRNAGSGVTAIYDPGRANLCTAPATTCSANLVAYQAVNPNAGYIQAAKGALPNAARNTMPIRPINDLDATAVKRFTFVERYNLEFSAQAFNVLNHAQYLPGTIDNINSPGFTSSVGFQTVTSGGFAKPGQFFTANARSMQLALKFSF